MGNCKNNLDSKFFNKLINTSMILYAISAASVMIVLVIKISEIIKTI